MDYAIIRETLNAVLDEVAFKKDTDGNDVSIFHRSQENLKQFLTENTSIPDDKKAESYANFLTNIIVGVTTQAIQVAGESPLRDAQIDTMKSETAQKIISMQKDDDVKTQQIASMIKDDDIKEREVSQKITSMQNEDTDRAREVEQKIISMQNEDKARANEVASKVADIKARIETLYPAQVREIDGNILYRQAQTANEAKKNELLDKDLSLKDKDMLLRDKEIDLKAQDILVKEKEAYLKEKMADIEAGKLPLINAQTLTELKRPDLMDEDIRLRQQDVILKGYLADNERSKLQLTAQQIGLTQSEIQYKLAQIKAIQEASKVNKEIEHEKNETQLKIAELYAVAR